MDLKNEQLGVSFTIPTRPTVRQQLEYLSEAGNARGREMWLRYWAGAVMLITNWVCEALPDPNVDLDSITDTKQTGIIMWAAIEVYRHMNSLDTIPKD